MYDVILQQTLSLIKSSQARWRNENAIFLSYNSYEYPVPVGKLYAAF